MWTVTVLVVLFASDDSPPPPLALARTESLFADCIIDEMPDRLIILEEVEEGPAAAAVGDIGGIPLLPLLLPTAYCCCDCGCEEEEEEDDDCPTNTAAAALLAAATAAAAASLAPLSALAALVDAEVEEFNSSPPIRWGTEAS